MAGDSFDALGNRLGFTPLASEFSAPAPPGTGSGGSSGEAAPLTDTFKLHSRPTATKTIYMDFDGFTARFTTWRPNGEIVSPPFDLDRNPGSFSDDELRAIQRAWQRVAADFAPFDINVTTEDPGEAALVNTGGSDDRWGIRVVITPNSEPAPGTGGVAYFGSFRWGYHAPGATDTPCYAFNLSDDSLAMTVSHEVGHSLDLSHDGRPGQVYYPGHGTGVTRWGAIMGAPFGMNMTTWSRGEYRNSNNQEDDLSIIASSANGFGFLADDFANNRGSATELTGPIGLDDRHIITQLGTIHRNTDLDVFRLQAGGGLFEMTIDPLITKVWTRKSDGSFVDSIATASISEGTNLDVEVKLFDETGNVLATSNPPDSLGAQLRLELSPGVYYLSIDGVGFGDPLADPPTGYTDYGSLGQYLVTGSFPVGFGVAVSDSVLTYVENEPPKPISPSVKILDNFPGSYASGSLLVGMTPASGATDFITLDFSGTPDLAQNGSIISFQRIPVGSFARFSDTSFRINLLATATKGAIEAVLNTVRFEAKGDSPDTFDRSIQITLIKGTAVGVTSVQVNAVQVNDRPIASVAPMNSIDEDDVANPGTKVGAVIDRGVTDVDGTRGKAIAVTGLSNEGPSGVWQVDLGRGWTNLGTVSPSAALVLGTSAGLRFVPAPNFFGTDPVLKYFALDEAYVGPVSAGAQRVFVDVTKVQAPDSISLTAGEIRMTVKAINDAPMAVEPIAFTILQDEEKTFTLPSTAFKDADEDFLVYSAFVRPGVNLPGWITFDPTTRQFTLKPTNDHVGTQQFVVRASDPSQSFGDGVLTVNVINVNDPPTDIRLFGEPVPENSLGAFVGRLTATDPDYNDAITWSLVTNPLNRLELRGNDLYLTAQSQLNFETERSFSFSVRGTDSGGSEIERELSVQVQDINEFAPALEPIAYSIPESSTPGSVIGQVTAIDNDTVNHVRYRFLGVAPSQFILSETGTLTLATGIQLDFESKSSYQFFVEAYDDGAPSLSTWVSATVSVTNSNDFAPEISTSSLVISEKYPLDVPVGRIMATDRDDNSILFSLQGGETRFNINPVTGELRLNQPGLLDFERSGTEFVVVRASDNGSPQRTTEKTITITVENANEPPTSFTVERIKIPANISGYDLGRINVQDPDGPTNYTITPLDDRLQVVGGNLRLKPGRFLADTDPPSFVVPLLLKDSDGAAYRMDVTLERIANPKPWQNPQNPLDADRDGLVGVLDALTVINALNSGLTGRLSVPRDNNSLSVGSVDIDGDGQATPLDALAIINALNDSPNRRSQSGGEGEGPSSSVSGPASFVEVDGYFAGYDFESDPLLSRTRRLARSRNT